MSKKGLREISWNDERTCIYDNGHLDPAEFLRAVVSDGRLEARHDGLTSLTLADVKHTRFSPWTPTQAAASGYYYGVSESTAHDRGYPVTMVLVPPEQFRLDMQSVAENSCLCARCARARQ